MAVEVGDDLVNHRGDRTTAAIHDALAADLHYIYPRQNCEIGRGLGCTLNLGVAERSLDQALAEFAQDRVGCRVMHCGGPPHLKLE